MCEFFTRWELKMAVLLAKLFFFGGGGVGAKTKFGSTRPIPSHLED